MMNAKKESRDFPFLRIALVVVLNLLILAFALWSTLPPPAPALRQTLAQPGTNGEEVRQIQTRLKQWGYFTASVNGSYGPQTTAAVTAFQHKHGLPGSGIADEKTLALMGISAGQSAGAVADSQLQLLGRIISAEARGEPYTGQVAVGAVVLNRVESSSFPDSLAGVIYQPGAFTAITDGQINEPVAESALRAAQEAFNGADPSGGALYYFNPEKTSNKWMRTRPVITTIGKHLFCS